MRTVRLPVSMHPDRPFPCYAALGWGWADPPPGSVSPRSPSKKGSKHGTETCPATDRQRGVRDRVMTGAALLRRGVNLERVTLAWNVVGIAVLAVAAIAARSVALAGFGLDSLVEIGASTVVLWELAGTDERRQHRALRLIGAAFIALAIYVAAQSTVVLVTGYHPRHSLVGIGWTALTAATMFVLAAGKAQTGRALNNPALLTEGRVTFVDGLLATAVLIGLALNAAFGAWWADPLAGFVIVFYGLKEARAIFAGSHEALDGPAREDFRR
jgi:divalent metal cation (Fe/Co/Zn/Cd) transporter